MKLHRMLKFERLYREYIDAVARTDATRDFEGRRTMGPTLTNEQINRSTDATWARLYAEIARKAAQQNPYAVEMKRAIDEDDWESRDNAIAQYFDDIFGDEQR